MSTFIDPPTMAEKKRLIAEASRATTYNKLAQSTDPESLGGRFATGASVVSGAASHVPYPPMPDGPWSGPQPGLEAPLGYSVEEAPIVGEQWEIEKSLASLERAPEGQTRSEPASASDDASRSGPSGASSVAAIPSTTIRKRSFVAG